MKRLSGKDYDETLKIMRRWPDPYRALMAKVVHHVSWQFAEIERLDKRLRELEQIGLAEDKSKSYVATPKVTPPYESHVKKNVKWPIYKRLSYLSHHLGWESLEVNQILKWNSLSIADAKELVRDYELSLDKA